MHKSALTIVAITLAAGLPASAQSSLDTAQRLANILASEEPCNLSINPDGIDAYVENNVAPDDLDFANNLRGMITVSDYSIASLSESELVAQCAATRRAARKFDLIDE